MPGKLTSPFSLGRAGILPGPRRKKKQKHLRAELEGNLPPLLQFSPEIPGACLALLRRSLCLPFQIREYLGFLRASQVVLVVLCLCERPKRHRFDHPWVGKIPWRRAWQPTPVFMPGESQGPRSLVGYSSWDCEESDTIEAT